MKKRLDVKITGDVQGVGFRWSARETAKKLGIAGCAENLLDSSVRVVAEGEEADLQKFLLWCQEGPRFAKVEEVSVEWSEATGKYEEFTIP